LTLEQSRVHGAGSAAKSRQFPGIAEEQTPRRLEVGGQAAGQILREALGIELGEGLRRGIKEGPGIQDAEGGARRLGIRESSGSRRGKFRRGSFRRKVVAETGRSGGFQGSGQGSAQEGEHPLRPGDSEYLKAVMRAQETARTGGILTCGVIAGGVFAGVQDGRENPRTGFRAFFQGDP